MDFKKAVQKQLIDRFEMMELAEIASNVHFQSKRLISLNELSFDGKKYHFVLNETLPAKKKEIRMALSPEFQKLQKLVGKRLGNIFLNHYMACQNDISICRWLPKSKTAPFLVACGGLSGTGKSRVSRESSPELASPFGALIIRDDIVRKQLAGVAFSENLGPEYYTPDFEGRVYREMRRQTRFAIKSGYPVIIEGLFYNAKDRRSVKHMASVLNIPFIGIWLEAPLGSRVQRVTTRKNNPSDVKLKEDIIKQNTYDVGDVDWIHLMTEREKENTVREALKLIKKELKSFS